MAPSRAYVPSRALLRALSRPLPPRCHLVRPFPTQFLRGKRDKTAPGLPKLEKKEGMPDLSQLKFVPTPYDESETEPLPDDQLDNPDLPTISWWEQDANGREHLISRIATPEDRRKHNELSKMLHEDAENPDYDDALLNRRLLDDLMKYPSFADLTEELQELKQSIVSREEAKAAEEETRKDQELQTKQLESSLKMATYESIQELVDDPELADTRDDLEDLLEQLPDAEDTPSPEFLATAKRLEAKLANNEAFQRKMTALRAEQGVEEMPPPIELPEAEEHHDTLDEGDQDALPGSPEDMDKLLVQMKDLMASMGADKELQAELDEVIKEDPFDEAEEEEDMDFDKLSDELINMVKAATPEPIDENGDVVDPELEAKVDKIMQDPKLLEKLMYIKKVITEAQLKSTHITDIAHETAPDPLTLEPERATSLGRRIELAKSDPEHRAALRRLRVDLLPPFNISPALKSFNQAIELAYMGANDDIRRILWRTYYKARTLPTFLQNLSDDAWDILYYSQAVTWAGNQNRQQHLKMLLKDLKSVGRDGPPTHPSTLVKN
ncbi:hypothetical protein K458DRAFT_388561 [Lentithecium fluviatile CBS 122367]|uniref:Uncharacterized protein n=1 Tax=Lentithecium fluviatile CBS 122367 TaxID=1168545 RepID=A0A6G1J3Q5_9PLEO|nr:hypothetical protein K458DRAFT_388561 [Lentithecium fluviatile CBS 122367]